MLSDLCSHTQLAASPDVRDKSTPRSDHGSISRYIDKTFPGLENEPSILETCMYTMTPDQASIIDLVPGQRNIAFACGFSGTGFKKAPEIGKMLTQLLNPPSNFNMNPFCLSRFNKLPAKM